MSDAAVVERDVEAEITARRVAALEDIPPQSDGWLEARKIGLGGSDAAAVLGLGEFASSFEVYLDKTGQHPAGLTIPDNEPMKWGRLLEDPIAEECARRLGLTYVKPKYLYQHWDLDWMLANPDRIAIDPARPDPGIYEGKTCSHWMADRWGEHDTDPATYALLQAVHYMTVLDFKWAVIAVLIAGQDYRHYRIERDEELVGMLVEFEADFWDHVLRRNPPDPTGSEADTDLLSRLYDALPGKKIIVGDDEVQFVRDYHRHAKVAKEAEELKRKAGNMLRAAMGDAEEAVTPQGLTVATWRKTETTKFDQKRFEEEMPKFSATYKYRAPHRPLLPKNVDKKKG